MMKSLAIWHGAILLAALILAGSPALADLEGDLAVTFSWSSAGAGTDTMRGWMFSTNDPVEITALGVFDHWNPNGLLTEHDVAIWDSDEQIVAFATVPAADAAPQILSPVRFVEIVPVILPANETFIIASQHIDVGRDDWFATQFNSIDFHPSINFIEGRYTNTTDFVIPTTTFATPSIGPSFLLNVVPEPAISVLLFAAAPLSLRRRRA